MLIIIMIVIKKRENRLAVLCKIGHTKLVSPTETRKCDHLKKLKKKIKNRLYVVLGPWEPEE